MRKIHKIKDQLDGKPALRYHIPDFRSKHAVVYELAGTEIVYLYSYGIHVATYYKSCQLLLIFGRWSVTTDRHCRRFTSYCLEAFGADSIEVHTIQKVI